MRSTNKIMAFAAILALPTGTVTAKRTLRTNRDKNNRRLRRGQIEHVDGANKQQKRREQKKGGLEEDVEFFTNMMRRTQDMSIPISPEPTPFPTGGGTDSGPIDDVVPTLVPTPFPIDPPVAPPPAPNPTLPPIPATMPPQSTTDSPVTPPPTPPPVPPLFQCPDPNVVGCTAVDPTNPVDECPTVGEPCVDGNPGEFCCLDGCPRNYCTAKQAPMSVSEFVPLIGLDHQMDDIADAHKRIEEEGP